MWKLCDKSRTRFKVRFLIQGSHPNLAFHPSTILGSIRASQYFLEHPANDFPVSLLASFSMLTCQLPVRIGRKYPKEVVRMLVFDGYQHRHSPHRNDTNLFYFGKRGCANLGPVLCSRRNPCLLCKAQTKWQGIGGEISAQHSLRL